MGNRVVGLVAWGVVAVMLACLAATPAGAVPNLQLYIEGATYDNATETWVTGSGDFELQIIGAMNGHETMIEDVNLVAALVPGDTDPSTGSITFTGDGFTVGAPSAFVNGIPVLSDGRELPTHGIYPAYHTIAAVGDFSPLYTVYNMVDGGSAMGEVKRVHVNITGFERVHFDAYNHVPGATHASFAPFSHDGEGEGEPSVPEPGTLALLALGLTGSLGLVRRKSAR